ncbi:MAG: CBS domain-containing protein [Burkholderiaceae bacterium]|nr:MAG: CBS domain-containing protein [Burkholderiaceae bacterium]
MKVREILRVKGNTLYTVNPDTPVAQAVSTMAELDIGSLVVMNHGRLTGMLTFREVLKHLHDNDGAVGAAKISAVMNSKPVTATPETEINDLRRMMLEEHVRYMPILDGDTLAGVVSFYDVAKAVLEEQAFENKMLKAYIRDWPAEEASDS